MNPLHLDRLTEHSFQAYQDGSDVFTVRKTTEGWKTEGNPAYDGLLCASLEELTDEIEGRH